MKVLIVSGNRQLAEIWGRHLLRSGMDVGLVESVENATSAIRELAYPVIVIDVEIGEDAVADICSYAAYREPDCRLVLVSNSSFFSSSQVFNLIPNTCAVMPAQVTPRELEAVVEYHGEQHCG